MKPYLKDRTNIRGNQTVNLGGRGGKLVWGELLLFVSDIWKLILIFRWKCFTRKRRTALCARVWTSWVLQVFLELFTLLNDLVGGDGFLQVLQRADPLPLGAGLDLDGDVSVLVHTIFGNLLLISGIPDNFCQLTPPFSKLKIKKKVILCKIAFSYIIPASEHSSGQSRPGRARLSVTDTDDVGGVGAPLVQGMTGLNIRHR